MKTLARVLMILVGLALLLPGACSLAVLPFGVPVLVSAGLRNLPDLMPFVLIWLSGFVLSAAGVWLLRKSSRI